MVFAPRLLRYFGEDSTDGKGSFEMLDWFAELTIYTSTTCLIGPKFRAELTPQFAELFHDLEKGTDALAFVDPYLDIPSFHRRDEARAELARVMAMGGGTSEEVIAYMKRCLVESNTNSSANLERLTG